MTVPLPVGANDAAVASAGKETPLTSAQITCSLRVKAKPSIEVRGDAAPFGGGRNCAMLFDRIRLRLANC